MNGHRCYLDTSILRGCTDANFLKVVARAAPYQVFVSALAIRELVAAVKPAAFERVRAALRRATCTPGVLQDNRLPEGIVAESFGCDSRELRVDGLIALAKLALAAHSFAEFQQRQAHLHSQYGGFYSTDWHTTDEALANDRFMAASQAGWEDLRGLLSKSSAGPIYVADRQFDPATFFDDWSADGKNFDLNQSISVLALAADVARWLAPLPHKSSVWNPDTKMVYERYRGGVDVFCSALAHYNVPRRGAGRTAKRNDVIDIKHFLYLGGRDSCDIFLTADRGQAEIGKVAAPGRVWLLDEWAVL